jgi:hypothetical protein
MGIQIIHHQGDTLSVRVVDVNQIPYLVRLIDRRPGIRHLMRDAFHITQLNHLLSEQAQRPSTVTFRRFAVGNFCLLEYFIN